MVPVMAYVASGTTDRMLAQLPQQVFRTRYKTNVTDDDPEFEGNLSATFPAENPSRRIVSVDWSTPGEVEITWLITAVS